MLVQCNEIKKDAKAAEPIKGISRLDVNQHDVDVLTEVLLKPSGLGPMEIDKNKHFYSRGAFNLIQLVLYLLKQTGPAHIFISSYSISEESLATLLRHKERGDILSIKFLIDNRVRTISPKPFDYLVTAFPDCYRCCALHAKVALLWNGEHSLSVVGSQNATHNPKLERGIIHTEETVFQFDYKVLTDEFNNGTT